VSGSQSNPSFLIPCANDSAVFKEVCLCLSIKFQVK
jgi:hypothetical protein